MRAAVVLFTRDLRVRDNPALAAAGRAADRVLPLFVLDPRLTVPPNRRRFLAESLADLRDSLRRLGGDLVIRHGDPVAEAVSAATGVGAEGIWLAADVSRYAHTRQRRLAEACATHRLALTVVDAVTVVPAGALRPSSGGDHYQVFTPYWRAWQAVPHRAEVPAPRKLALPDGVAPGTLPDPTDNGGGGSADPAPGGESAGRDRLRRWRTRADRYADAHDLLAEDGTSRLSPYLHFGCLSPITVLSRVDSTEYARQVCWRDFYQQLLAGFPDLARRPFRPGAPDAWPEDPDALDRWRAGQTGVPVVDAGMRQLTAEGFMHNRARLLTASFLTKTLGLDWRAGLDWYGHWLLDADVANNAGNWQWVAGTGTDTKPYRRFNPIRQAKRFDPDGDYVRRYVPELATVDGPAVHEPWLLPASQRRGYPSPPAAPRTA